MSKRVQVILKEEEMAEFKHQARKQSKSLSAWMREAAYRMLQENEKKDLTGVNALKEFFMECKGREIGQEPDGGFFIQTRKGPKTLVSSAVTSQ